MGGMLSIDDVTLPSGIHTNKGRHPIVKVVIQWFSAKMDQMLIAVVKTLLVVLKVDYL